MNTLLMFVLLIAGGGLLGGVANYFMNRTEPGWKKGDFWKSLVLGVAAAAVVPLFLQTVQSELMANCTKGDDWYISCFVFFGFCTIAAIFSSRFLTSIADHLLKKVDQMEQQQAQLQQTADTLVAVNSDDQGGAPGVAAINDDDDDFLESFSKSASPMNPEEKLMGAMVQGKHPFRTVDVLAKDTGLDAGTVENLLKQLETRGKVRSMRRKSDGATLWMLQS